MDIERIISGLREAQKIADGYVPTEADLAGAPLISNWIFATAPGDPGPTLVGSITGHPTLGNSALSTTSVVLAIDVEAGWARTVSRYYRLGPRAGMKTN